MAGKLFAIGGAEAKLRRRTVMGAFVAAAEGTDARIAVVSSASLLGAEIVEVYQAESAQCSSGHVGSLHRSHERLSRTEPTRSLSQSVQMSRSCGPRRSPTCRC